MEAVVSSKGRKEFELPNKYKERKVAVVYYLSRNGHLEHPHFMEVPLVSPEGLYLRDVINRLNILRGKGIATMYSWSSKRTYKNGYVWHDLSENDFIYPTHGCEYVLKGSELLERSLSFRTSHETGSSSSSEKLLLETQNNTRNSDFPMVRRRNQSWSSIDLHEYKVVYKADSSGEALGKAADASTQTEDKRRRRRTVEDPNTTTELSREEISPPPSSSSPETLETLMKVDDSVINNNITTSTDESADIRNQMGKNHPSGRSKASAMLMQLISCGSITVNDANTEKNQGFSLVSHYKSRLPRGAADQIRVEDKEYFSGSLIMGTKKDDFPALKRSSSYNADRTSNLDLDNRVTVEEEETVRAKCLPRKSIKKEECQRRHQQQ